MKLSVKEILDLVDAVKNSDKSVSDKIILIIYLRKLLKEIVMIKRNSENFKVMQHLLNVGPLTAAGACQSYISNNLRSRVPELLKQGFDVVSVPIVGKHYGKYMILADKLEKNRMHFSKSIR